MVANSIRPWQESGLALNDSQLILNKRVFIAGTFELMLGVLAVGLGLWIGPDPHTTMPRSHEGDRLVSGLFDGVLVGLLMVYILVWLEKYNFSWIRKASQAGERVFVQLMQGAGFFHYLALSLAAGVGEELLFRGWLQSFLEMHLTNMGDAAPWVAIALSALVFGLVHPVTVGYVVLAFLLGCLLGVAYHLTGNILVPIVAHTLYDLILMIRMVANARQVESRGNEKTK